MQLEVTCLISVPYFCVLTVIVIIVVVVIIIISMSKGERPTNEDGEVTLLKFCEVLEVCVHKL